MLDDFTPHYLYPEPMFSANAGHSASFMLRGGEVMVLDEHVGHLQEFVSRHRAAITVCICIFVNHSLSLK